MSNRSKEVATQVAVGVVLWLIGGALAIYVTGQLHAQDIASLRKSDDDKEMRIRTVESAIARIDSNVQWLKEQEQRRNK